VSRFSSDDYEEMFPNQGELWHANLQRAIKGKRGQRDLRTLEAALLALPAHRLIEGYIARGDEVCAVGAFALQRRVEKGEDREAVLAELREATTVYCNRCSHPEHDHHAHESGCEGCARQAKLSIEAGRPVAGWNQPHDFEYGYTEDDGDETARVGKRAGMTYVLAWRIGQLNDEDFARLSPEDRYVEVLAWVRAHIETVAT
jgi:hypothetical protein